MEYGIIKKINGPVIHAGAAKELSMHEMVYVGEEELIGEVIATRDDGAVIQVYESTEGIKVGEKVKGTGGPLSVTLAPGLMSNIFDGIERPLEEMEKASGFFITRGLRVDAVDKTKKRPYEILVKAGDTVSEGQVIATTPETDSVLHKILVPLGVNGKVTFAAKNGDYNITETLIKVQTENGEREINSIQRWPIKKARPAAGRMIAQKPLVTGQRVIDSLFPVAKGGAAAIPGGFGTGKTMTQHQFAKWSDADIIIYIGCGERGNEMTQVLEEFKELKDPRTGKSLLDRTILIANTSNMPVAAREASIYTGVTIAEYYRDMGYDIAIMADSTSRWAEALREISGRLEEMPAEEGFPAYLSSRLAGFYERAGYFKTLCGEEGSVTIIGTVSPQGGDFSEPVTQNTKRFTRCFLALDRSLAYARHYPAIQWMTSYSEYVPDLEEWYAENAGEDFYELRTRIIRILREESELMEIVKLVGGDVLPDLQKLTLETAKVIRVGFLQQNAYHKEDTYVPIKKQREMMKTILYLYDKAKELVTQGVPVSLIREEGIFDDITLMKYKTPNENYENAFSSYRTKTDAVIDKLRQSQL